jgi:SAM-dependent methyltransferase
MDNAEAIRDRIADGYAKKPVADLPAYERTLARTRAHLASTDRVLEVGGGTGTTALLLAPHVRHATAIARREADQGVTNVPLVRRGLFEDGFEERGWDAVLAVNFLHLMPDPAASCRRIDIFLKPGGLFVSKSVCLAGYRHPLRLVLPLLQLMGRAAHVTILATDDLERAVTRAGFEIVEAGLDARRPASYFIVARKVSR